jgi:predicted pyridoxine 5'-phosphate oxidase superfamily flavin-nucleotide-binding protein
MNLVDIPTEVQEFLSGKLAWVATVSAGGEPNVTPKGTLRLLDSQHILFADLFSNKTRQNLLENKRIAVTVADAATGKGYQLKGSAELLDTGPLFEDACERVAAMQRGLPKPRSVVRIGVDAVFDQSGETEPGRRIA